MLGGMDDDTAAYELHGVTPDGGEPPLRLIGRYATYEEAFRARDEDVLNELAARGGWYTVIEHVIVGPGLLGPRTVHPHATALGVDPALGRIPNQGDLDDARRWLTTIGRA